MDIGVTVITVVANVSVATTTVAVFVAMLFPPKFDLMVESK